MSGYRPPYTIKEEKLILKYIIKHQGYYQLRGRKFWVQMEESLPGERTWQSMKEHFRKQMIPNIANPLYNLSSKEISFIRDGYKVSANDGNDAKQTKYPARNLDEYMTSDESD
uniref:Telomeric repeat-binding factor 2-interacting protein 1 n=1 Tax=Photinus pyralis TaxID=7054 RepID=A0A1Y1NB96_PHOPY